MKTDDLLKTVNFHAVSPVVSREISGVYCGELPGEALGKLRKNNVWITACASINTLAVAYQKNAACVIIAENFQTDEEFSVTAQKHGITVFRTRLPVYESAIEIYNLMK